MTTVTKQDLAELIAEATDASKAAADRALAAVLDKITDTLTEGGEVAMAGFGKFETGHRAARTGRNPQTGAEIQIPASRVVKFKAGKKLKDAVNV